MTATVIQGHCTKCNTPINRIDDKENPVLFIDGHRFQYPEDSVYHVRPVYCIFRCEKCGCVVDDNWLANPAADRTSEARSVSGGVVGPELEAK